MRDVDLSHCFGCGMENPIGLHLKKEYVGDMAQIEYEVRPEHCGYPGLLHGGITCVLMDEVTYHAAARLGVEVVTVTLAVDYKRPVTVGQRVVCRAWVKGHEDRNMEVGANMVDAVTGDCLAEGTALFREVDLQKYMEKLGLERQPNKLREKKGN